MSRAEESQGPTDRREPWQLDLGANFLGPDHVRLRVWAPRAKGVSVRLIGRERRPIPMQPRELGYFEADMSGVVEGDRYRYVLDDDTERPDPASRFQPDGVHGPSAVVNPGAFRWTDQGWRGLTRDRLVIYELHVGTFTREGTFQAVVPLLDYLRRDVGVTAIELMPVAQFPGTRNWGYDGASPFAPQASYGGPRGLRLLVDACHAKGLGVILDVVYNHLGPEGNYLGDFGPYFTDRYRTPWGAAINYDGPDSDQVRHYFISNALYWITEYHLDGLRLDAIHGIYDFGARHILRELTDAVHAQADRLGRSALVIAESDLNDVRVIAPPEEGGHGLDAQWNDDFHHALHARLTGERDGYYQDFGRLDQLAAAMRDGFVYTGQRSAYRRRRHGSVSRGRPPSQFVVFAQNHDQVGNRARGDRLSTLIPFDALKVAAAAVLLAPNIPLLFMGEEYGERAPFLYFTDHGDPALVEAVRRGRRAEFAAFGWAGDIPDPQDPETFARSLVHPGEQTDPRQAALLRWYRRLLDVRRSVPALAASESGAAGHRVWTDEAQQVLTLHRWAADGSAALVLLGFDKGPASIGLLRPEGEWRLALDSGAGEFGGTGEMPLPPRLSVAGRGLSFTLPGHRAALYLRAGVAQAATTGVP